ncbi:MAG: GTPase ObgE [Erysipelotrichaceae bacterium]|nr:GTPase ObgE [Erysipelotrichaceae bacterium]MBR2745454.1 GTPase ObgE [Erysipelotrichaceae bacterium]
MHFIDQTSLILKAGKGGDGIVSFRREAHVPLGGPFGGDGGKGGSIIFEVDTHKSTLLDLHFLKMITAQSGENGKTKKMHGADGEDKIVKVPLGTVVRDKSDNRIIADLTHPGQQAVIARGGKGGRGNFHFKSARNPAPDFSEKGEEGQQLEVEIELKLLADVGLVGFPSVGKSTILSVVSAARPEIADYPFTTLVPNLGVVRVPDGRSFVLADMPGLIEGASQGKGLGFDFLRHIERTRVLIHVLDMSPASGRDPLEDYEIINNEMGTYRFNLLQRPQIVVANKMDEDGAEENLERFRKAHPDLEVFPTTALIAEGLQEVLYRAADLLDVTEPFPLQQDENIGVLYKYEPEPEPFTIRNLGNGQWVVEGDEINRLFSRTDFENEQQVMQFGIALRKMGVDAALREKGIQEKDTVFINDFGFEFTDMDEE